MDSQPMLPSTISAAGNTVEEVSVGCIMHRYKGYKAKRRWGQLRVEVKQKSARCFIRLYKHDVLNIHQEVNRSKEPKLKFEFNFSNEDFCGLERGEHYDKNGQRRYLCIISRDKHLIIEDAVVTAAGINHNVLGTWSQLIAQAMKYVSRWKVVEINPKLASKICYLHVSMENVSECHSLEDKTKENRSNLVLRSWKTRHLGDVKERPCENESENCTEINFTVTDNSGSVDRVNLVVEGTTNLKQIVQKLKRENGEVKKTSTVCPGFDDLNYHPNLIPKQKPSKGLRGYLAKTVNNSKPTGQDTVDMQQSKKANRHSHGNHYVTIKSEDSNTSPPPYYNVNHPPKNPLDRSPSSNPLDEASTFRKGAPGFHEPNSKIQVPPSLIDQGAAQRTHGDFLQPIPRSSLPSNGWNSRVTPPQLPSPGIDDNDLKKAPSLATQISFDSDYHTDDQLLLTESSISQSRYSNLPQNSEFSSASLPRNNSGSVPSVYQNLKPEQPPAVPVRDEQPSSQGHAYVNMMNRAPTSPSPNRVSQPPPIPPKYNRPNSAPAPNAYVFKLAEANGNDAPPVPERPGSSVDDTSRSLAELVASSIERGTLPPLRSEELQPQAYENSLEFEISINDVLQGAHLNSVGGRWLDLPMSVIVKIALGLEKEGITVGDWKALAERLGLTFHNIQQLSSLMRLHSMLRPFEVVMLHWSRTQYPLPFTRENLRELLIEIGRDDLAHMIPF